MIINSKIIEKYSTVETLERKDLIEIGRTSSITIPIKFLNFIRDTFLLLSVEINIIENYLENRAITLIQKYNNKLAKYEPEFYAKDRVAEFAISLELSKHPRSILSKTNKLAQIITAISAKYQQIESISSSNLETLKNIYRDNCSEEERVAFLNDIGAIIPEEVEPEVIIPALEMLLAAVTKDSVAAVKTTTLKFLSNFITEDSKPPINSTVDKMSNKITNLSQQAEFKYQQNDIPKNILDILNDLIPLLSQPVIRGKVKDWITSIKNLLLNALQNDEFINLLIENLADKLIKSEGKGNHFHFTLSATKLKMKALFLLPSVTNLPLFGPCYPRGPFLQKEVQAKLDKYFNSPNNQQIKISNALRVLIDLLKKTDHTPAQKTTMQKVLNKLTSIATEKLPLLEQNEQAILEKLLLVLSSINKGKLQISSENESSLQKGVQTLHDYLETTKVDLNEQKSVREILEKFVEILIPYSETFKEMFNLFENFETVQKIAKIVQEVVDLRKKAIALNPEAPIVTESEIEAKRKASEAIKTFLTSLVDKHLNDIFNHLNSALQKILK